MDKEFIDNMQKQIDTVMEKACEAAVGAWHETKSLFDEAVQCETTDCIVGCPIAEPFKAMNIDELKTVCRLLIYYHQHLPFKKKDMKLLAIQTSHAVSVYKSRVSEFPEVIG